MPLSVDSPTLAVLFARDLPQIKDTWAMNKHEMPISVMLESMKWPHVHLTRQLPAGGRGAQISGPRRGGMRGAQISFTCL